DLFPFVAARVLKGVVESVAHVVKVLRLAVKDVAEITPAVPIPTVDRRGVVVARLAGHVDEPPLLGKLHDPLDLLDRLPDRNSAVQVLSALEHLYGLRPV